LELSRLDAPPRVFPTAADRYFLLGIHPLRYVIVHNAIVDAAEQRKWAKLREVPWARYLGRFGDDDLYRLTGDQSGTQVDKLFSWDYARSRTEVHFEVQPIGPMVGDRWVEVDLNDRPLGRQLVRDGPTAVAMALSQPLFHSAPNTVRIRWGYHDPDVSRRPIGRTGSGAPVDLHVVSGGLGWGNQASILVNGLERAPNRRGYNMVAIAPPMGAVLWADVFDTSKATAESTRLAGAIARLPRGTIVAAAVREEASHRLTEEAVGALRSLGAAQDLRSRVRASHLLVGVKGAPPGSALEQSGFILQQATVGTPPDRIGMEIRQFELR
jgi:hypothetical protein